MDHYKLTCMLEFLEHCKIQFRIPGQRCLSSFGPHGCLGRSPDPSESRGSCKASESRQKREVIQLLWAIQMFYYGKSGFCSAKICFKFHLRDVEELPPLWFCQTPTKQWPQLERDRQPNIQQTKWKSFHRELRTRSEFQSEYHRSAHLSKNPEK